MQVTNTIPATGPYKDAGLNTIYQLLFCDDRRLFKAANNPGGYPWETLLADQPDLEMLKKIVADPSLDTRCKILANNIFLANGITSRNKVLQGVILEVGLPDGLDVLAAYLDGTARYINHSGRLLIWETETPESKQLIEKLFDQSNTIVARIGPWDQARRPAPANGNIRLNFLVSDGLYFGEGPFDVLSRDPMAAPVIDTATRLLTYLTEMDIKRGNK